MAWHRAVRTTFLATPILLWAYAPSFAIPASRQKPTSVVREQNGLSISMKAPGSAYEMSAKEKVLASRLSEFGKRGDWQGARQLYATYTDFSVPVLTAAMQAAYRCGQYQEAARIYSKVCGARRELDGVGLLVGLKVFGKLRDSSMVDAIWAEASERGLVDMPLRGARIDAAAYMGDIEAAATVLDSMLTQTIDIDVYKFNSAIFACANAERPGHNAAMYLFKLLLERNLSPTVVTFTNLAKAHARASLEQIQHVRATMKKYGIRSDPIFAECYVSALLQGKFGHTASTTADLADLPEREGRLQEAETALLEFQANNVDLSGMCRAILRYVRKSSL
ncbi:unnamed protein product [Symbiodinium natans]|uniref:Pentacotripeptide-repeat region of PRORP domain-containing protein n=1 Tax=Symbiodinium natans TaxID=878477 RepID=A0A812QZP4_9DINO|nr:unnamed protein product [Symbiodinium natans]